MESPRCVWRSRDAHKAIGAPTKGEVLTPVRNAEGEFQASYQTVHRAHASLEQRGRSSDGAAAPARLISTGSPASTASSAGSSLALNGSRG